MTTDPIRQYRYKGSSGEAVEGLTPDACLDQLARNNPAGDAFFLSPDQLTISHHREGGVIDVLHKRED